MANHPLSDLFNINPFPELASLREALRQIVEAGWPMPRDLLPAGMAAVVIPLDVLDTGPDLLVQTNLPGVKPDDVNVTVSGKTLTIKGSSRPSEQIRGAIYLHHERHAAHFFRAVNLPVEVDADQAEAHFEDGVLTLTLPKAAVIRPKPVQIIKNK